MGHLLVTNDFPPKVGGIQTYLWDLWSRPPPDEATVLTTPHPDAAGFDADLPFVVERTSESFLAPTPSLAWGPDPLARRGGRCRHRCFAPGSPRCARAPARPALRPRPHGAEVTVFGRIPAVRPVVGHVLRGADLVLSPPAGTRWRRASTPRAGPSTRAGHPPRGRPAPVPPAGPRRAGGRPGGASVSTPRPSSSSASRASSRVRAWTSSSTQPPTCSPPTPASGVVIVGTGRDHGRLLRRIGRTGAPAVLLGKVPAHDLPALYACADVFVMLCRNRWGGLEQEGFGIVFLEAAAAGVAQVAGRSGGAHEAVVDGETGYVVEHPTDVGEVAAALAWSCPTIRSGRPASVPRRLARAVAETSTVTGSRPCCMPPWSRGRRPGLRGSSRDRRPLAGPGATRPRAAGALSTSRAPRCSRRLRWGPRWRPTCSRSPTPPCRCCSSRSGPSRSSGPSGLRLPQPRRVREHHRRLLPHRWGAHGCATHPACRPAWRPRRWSWVVAASVQLYTAAAVGIMAPMFGSASPASPAPGSVGSRPGPTRRVPAPSRTRPVHRSVRVAVPPEAPGPRPGGEAHDRQRKGAHHDRRTAGARVFDVISDFARYPKWAPDIKATTASACDDEGRATEVEYRAAAMGRSVSVHLRCTLRRGAPERLSWQLIGSDTVKRYDGTYARPPPTPAADDGPSTELEYELTVELLVPLPGFVKRRPPEHRIVKAAMPELKTYIESGAADRTA